MSVPSSSTRRRIATTGATTSRMRRAACCAGGWRSPSSCSGSRGRVLDVGMGTGRLCAELDRRGWEVSGVDLSPAMVVSARRRLPQLAERLVEGPIEHLPFDDESFDAVAATGVLEYATHDLAAPLPSWRACYDWRAWPSSASRASSHRRCCGARSCSIRRSERPSGSPLWAARRRSTFRHVANRSFSPQSTGGPFGGGDAPHRPVRLPSRPAGAQAVRRAALLAVLAFGLVPGLSANAQTVQAPARSQRLRATASMGTTAT